jgi:hypothetical protein
MPKPLLFIGCAREEIELAEDFQVLLNEVADVKIWDYQTFFPGEHPLESLRRELLHTDFALLLITPDDKVTKRKMKGFTARDNIIFELGLFMGVQGPMRAISVVVTKKVGRTVKKVLMPGDLAGLTQILLTIEAKQDNSSAIRKACTEVKNAIKRSAGTTVVNLLPSTSLAIGYFKNFVLQVCEQLITMKRFKLGKRYYDLTKDIFDFYIVIPDSPSNASHEGFARFVRRNDLTKVVLQNRNRSRTFPFYVDSVLRKQRVLLFDYPTTLLSVREAIRLAVPASTTEHDILALEQREIYNFIRTLQKLLKEPSAANFGDNIKVILLSQLAAVYKR